MIDHFGGPYLLKEAWLKLWLLLAARRQSRCAHLRDHRLYVVSELFLPQSLVCLMLLLLSIVIFLKRFFLIDVTKFHLPSVFKGCNLIEGCFVLLLHIFRLILYLWFIFIFRSLAVSGSRFLLTFLNLLFSFESNFSLLRPCLPHDLISYIVELIGDHDRPVTLRVEFLGSFDLCQLLLRLYARSSLWLSHWRLFLERSSFISQGPLCLIRKNDATVLRLSNWWSLGTTIFIRIIRVDLFGG